MSDLGIHKKYLEDQQAELQQKYDYLTDLIKHLQNSEITEDLSPKEQWKLKQQIEEAKQQRETIVQKLQEIEETLVRVNISPNLAEVSYPEIHAALLELGYFDQDVSFYKIYRDLDKANYSIAAFLIHGPTEEYGQLWLFNRLLKKRIGTPKTRSNSKIFKIELSSLSQVNNSQRIFREISRRYPEIKNNNSSIKQLAESICQWWQSQNVFLVFTGVTESILSVLLEEIWNPIVNQAMALNAPPSQYKLFMFLVDYGKLDPKPNLFIEQFCKNFKASLPFLTPKLTEFDEKILHQWLFAKSQIFPDGIVEEFETLVQDILDNSEGGIPELVFEEICDRCKVNWEEIKTERGINAQLYR